MKNFLEILILIIPPVAYALWNGRNGLKHPNYRQARTVAYIMFFSVTFVRFIALWNGSIPFAKDVSDVLTWYLKAFVVSITGMGLFFPPLMNWVLTRKNMFWNYGTFWHKVKYCLDHLSPTAVPDKYFLKWGIPWQIRLAIYLTLFILSVIWFAL
jgi:hypothetical protein